MPPRNKDFAAGPRIESWPEHPLFPVDEGDVPPEVGFITVTRKEAGRMVWGPCFRADELTTPDQIVERFGGGEYELQARALSRRDPSMPGNITKRRWMVLPGKSRPLSSNPTEAELRAVGEIPAGSTPATSSASAAPSASAGAGGMGDNLLIALLNMQAQQSQQFMAMMTQLMQSSKSEAAELAKASALASQQMTTMMLQMSGQQTQSMVAMMTALMQSRGGGPEEMAKYAELLESLGLGSVAGDKPGGESIGEIVSNTADIVQGLVLLKGSGQPATENGATIAPAGSAASVVEEAAKMQS